MEGTPGVPLCRWAHQSLNGGSYSSSACQALDGPASGSMPMLACGEREAMVVAPPTVCHSEVLPCFHGCLAFIHRHFLPQSPPSCLLSPSLHSQQQPLPWDCSTIPKLQLPAASPSRGPVSLSGIHVAAARTVWFSFHLGSFKSSFFTLSLKCFSFDSDSCLDVGIGPLLRFLHPLRACPVLVTLLFYPLVPLSCWVLHGSIYSFQLVSDSCLLSAGVPHALLCRKVYSWCIHGERCTPHPSTPPPSCSLHPMYFLCQTL